MELEFTTLYQKYKEPIFGYLYYLCGNGAVAEELAQEVFLKVYLNIGRFEGRSSFKTWVYRIAKNTFLDYARAAHQKQEFAPVEVLERMADPRAGPEEEALNQDRARAIARALEHLSPRYRNLLILRELQDLSYGEMAEVLGEELNQIKVGLYRARRQFQKVYDRQGEY